MTEDDFRLLCRVLLTAFALILCVVSVQVQLNKKGDTDTVTEMGVAVVCALLVGAWRK